MDLTDKVLLVQMELKAPKDKYNNFGKYAYRSAEGILEAVKPLLSKYGLLMYLEDSIEEFAGRVFVCATVNVVDIDTRDSLRSKAYAEIAIEKKGMDVSQITGTASSYARKYALNGVFLIDDTKDADTDEYHNVTVAPPKEQDGMKPIGKTRAKSLEGRLNSGGVNIDKLLQMYKVKDLSEITETQYYVIIEKLKAKENEG